jgi:hypothetical protein
MSTKLKVFLITFVALTSTASVVSAAPHAGGMGGSMPARSSPMFTHSGSGMFHNDGFDHFHHHTVIFIDAFGFPFFSPLPFYGYYPYPYAYPYPYGYYGYNYQGGGRLRIHLRRSIHGCSGTVPTCSRWVLSWGHRWNPGTANAASNSRLRTRP